MRVGPLSHPSNLAPRRHKPPEFAPGRPDVRSSLWHDVIRHRLLGMPWSCLNGRGFRTVQQCSGSPCVHWNRAGDPRQRTIPVCQRPPIPQQAPPRRVPPVGRPHADQLGRAPEHTTTAARRPVTRINGALRNLANNLIGWLWWRLQHGQPCDEATARLAPSTDPTAFAAWHLTGVGCLRGHLRRVRLRRLRDRRCSPDDRGLTRGVLDEDRPAAGRVGHGAVAPRPGRAGRHRTRASVYDNDPRC